MKWNTQHRRRVLSILQLQCRSLWWKRFAEKLGFEPGVKKWGSDKWCRWWWCICGLHGYRYMVQRRVISIWLTKRLRIYSRDSCKRLSLRSSNVVVPRGRPTVVLVDLAPKGPVVKVVLWSRRAYLTKPVWANPIPIPTPLIWRYLGVK